MRWILVFLMMASSSLHSNETEFGGAITLNVPAKMSEMWEQFVFWSDVKYRIKVESPRLNDQFSPLAGLVFQNSDRTHWVLVRYSFYNSKVYREVVEGDGVSPQNLISKEEAKIKPGIEFLLDAKWDKTGNIKLIENGHKFNIKLNEPVQYHGVVCSGARCEFSWDS